MSDPQAPLINPDAVIRRLTSAGMSETQATRKAQLLSKTQAAFETINPQSPQQARAFFVPGRIECLGKHTDYAGRRSLICAVEQGFILLCCPRSDQLVRIVAAETGEQTEFTISPDLQPTMGHWSNYPMTVAARIASNFPGELLGSDIAFISDLTSDGGMSSSSALLIACFLAIATANNLAQHEEYKRNITDRESLANYLGTVENGQTFGTLIGSKGVGTFGGSEDHTAILCGRAGQLSCYSYCPVRLERTITLPHGYIFAIAASGVVAAKTGQARQKYNRASLLALAVLQVWNESTSCSDPHLAAALASSPDSLDRFRDALVNARHPEFTAEELSKRFEHFFAESEQILPAASNALAAEDLTEFGREVDRSQLLTDTPLGNQVPNTVFLAQSARQLGATAASAFGGGFGGAVWALTRQENADEFLKDWACEYQKKYPREHAMAAFFLTRPGPAALCIQNPHPDPNVPIL